MSDISRTSTLEQPVLFPAQGDPPRNDRWIPYKTTTGTSRLTRWMYQNSRSHPQYTPLFQVGDRVEVESFGKRYSGVIANNTAWPFVVVRKDW